MTTHGLDLAFLSQTAAGNGICVMWCVSVVKKKCRPVGRMEILDFSRVDESPQEESGELGCSDSLIGRKKIVCYNFSSSNNIFFVFWLLFFDPPFSFFARKGVIFLKKTGGLSPFYQIP